jgi:hypothetical protein
MQLSHYDYLFAIGTIFAFLDAWNIGMFHTVSPFLMLTIDRANILQVPTMSPTRGPPRSVPGL